MCCALCWLDSKVLEAFVNMHKFEDLAFEEALREFLCSFRLPGESQKIDRMMEAFAKRFCDCNPGIFKTYASKQTLGLCVIFTLARGARLHVPPPPLHSRPRYTHTHTHTHTYIHTHPRTHPRTHTCCLPPCVFLF